jgi:hypothetical protein
MFGGVDLTKFGFRRTVLSLTKLMKLHDLSIAIFVNLATEFKLFSLRSVGEPVKLSL